MQRLFPILLVAVPALAGCSLFGGNAIRISGEALSVTTEVPEHAHLQVDGQCLTCLRHASEHLTDQVRTLEPELAKYESFAEQNSTRMVKKLTAPAAAPGGQTEE